MANNGRISLGLFHYYFQYLTLLSSVAFFPPRESTTSVQNEWQILFVIKHTTRKHNIQTPYHCWYVWLRWKRTCSKQTKVLESSLGRRELPECHYIYQHNVVMKRIKLWWRHDMDWHLLTITTVIVYWGAQWQEFNGTTD